MGENPEVEVEQNPPQEPETLEPALKKTKMSSSTSDDTTTTDKPRRYKRRKVAIFLAYCGVGYQGMQKNPGAKTIEGDLEDALFLTGALPEEERGQHKRYDWARSARTDKGVSAVGQVISGRFFVDPPGFVHRLNSVLSPQIRIFGFNRATPSFSAKKFCDRRRYVYLMPVFALDPSCHRDRESVLASLGSGEELIKCVECSDRGRKVLGVMGNKKDGGINSKEGLVHSGILSNTCDTLELGAEEKGMGVGVGECLKADVGVVEAKIVDQSGISSNSCDVLMLDAEDKVGDTLCLDVKKNGVKEGEDVAGEQLKINLGIAGSGITSNSEGALVSSIDEKANEQQRGNSCLEKANSEGEELKNDLGGSLTNEEGEGKEDAGGADLETSNGTAEGGEGRKGEFKYGEEVKERFNRILKYYEGTHNFHNFTTRTKAEDPSAKRYIVSFQANTTLTIDGIEFVKCEVVGQSFMLHQIRKMMGMAVAVMRNFASESIYETAFNQTVRINVPTAPEVGLYLDECFFTSYNNKWQGTHEELSMKMYAEEAEEFKLKNIYSHIADMEHKHGAAALWLHSLNRRNYPDLCQTEPQELAAPKEETVIE